MPAEYRARIEAGRPQLYALAKERYGVDMNQGPFGQNSRPALIGAKYAEAQGKGDAYADEVFHAYWQEAQPIEEVAVLRGIAERIGLDGEAFVAALNDPALVALVDADIEQATAYGLNGVPAIVFNNRYLVSGAQPSEVLREVADQVSGSS
jgi:predicted DsbA family dithiol-disulfide isomerase